ncbi:MAG: DnaA/Hda family protein [Tagaea sp.]|nr:DnaA/Hda family protein [Tagaea sp.]
MNARQLALAWPHRPAFAREDFLVAPANEAAVAWLDSWPDWPSYGLVVHGAEGSGKTHLAQAWRARSGAQDLSEALTGRAWVLEDADRHAPGETDFFHLLNRVAEARGHLLITARVPPARWSVRLPDLASRLKALPAVALGAPDDALIEAVLVKHFADRQLRVGPETVRYVARRLERSLAQVAKVSAALDMAALAEGRAVSVPLARHVLAAQGFDVSREE